MRNPEGRKFFRPRVLKLRSDFVLTAFQDAKPFLILIVARVLSQLTPYNQRPGGMSEPFNRNFPPHAPNIYGRCHPVSAQYLAQCIGVQALVVDETPAALSKFAFEHAAHQLLAFVDFILVRRFQGKPNRQLIMYIRQ